MVSEPTWLHPFFSFDDLAQAHFLSCSHQLICILFNQVCSSNSSVSIALDGWIQLDCSWSYPWTIPASVWSFKLQFGIRTPHIIKLWLVEKILWGISCFKAQTRFCQWFLHQTICWSPDFPIGTLQCNGYFMAVTFNSKRYCNQCLILLHCKANSGRTCASLWTESRHQNFSSSTRDQQPFSR